MKKRKPKRIRYYDHLRVLATLAVMMLHVAAIKWGYVDVNGTDWKVFNIYDSLVRWSVPVFVMISGALFLGREEIPVKQIYSKYVLRMAVAYIVWSFVYYLFGGESVSKQLSLLFSGNGVVTLIKGHYHLWFIPMITGLYICLPIIKQIALNEKASDYFLILSFIFWILIPECVSLAGDFGGEKLIKVVNALNDRVTKMSLGLVMNYVFYFILGYKLSKVRLEKKQRVLIYVLGLLGFAFTVWADQAVTLKTQKPVSTYYEYYCVNVMLEALAVFELYKNIPFRKGKFDKAIKYLSKRSFGAYLVHALVLEILQKTGLTTLSFHAGLSVPVITAIVFVLSFAISALLHRIPGVRKYCA